MIRPLNTRMTYAHPTFEAEPHGRGSQYMDLIGNGHEFRSTAGLYDETVLAVVAKGKIVAGDIAKILEAADQESEKTGRTREVFHDELIIFFEEWGWAFNKGAIKALEDELGELPDAPPRLTKSVEVYNERHVNSLFIQAAIDGRITGPEMRSLADAVPHGPRDHFDGNLRRLYQEPGLKFDKSGIPAFRAALDDDRFIAEIDLGRVVAKLFAEPVKKAQAEQIVAATKEHFSVIEESPDREQLREFFVAALERQNIDSPLDHPKCNAAARQVLADFFDGSDKVGRIMDGWRDQNEVTEEDAKELLAAIEWVGPTDSQATQAYGLQLAEALGHPHFEDPRLSQTACEVLDTGLFGESTAEGRAHLRNRDVLAMLEAVRSFGSNHTYHYGDPSEGDQLQLTFSSNYDRITIEGLRDEGIVTIEAESVSVGERSLPRPEAIELVEDARVQEAVFALLQRAVTANWPSDE